MTRPTRKSTSRSRAIFACCAGLFLASATPAAALVGGVDTAPGVYPWMCAIFLGTGGEASRICGASLIHPSWVLTAAHCVADKYPGDFEVTIGTGDSAALRRSVAEILVHPGHIFRNGQQDADLALLRLTLPVTDIEAVRVLEDPRLVGTGSSARVLGWGATGKVLQNLDLAIIPNGEITPPSGIRPVLVRDSLVVVSKPIGKGICQGDSGGPLLVQDRGEWRLAAVASYMIGDCGQYGVYNDLQPYRSWISSHVYPDFSEWARTLGINSLWEDPDGDGWVNFQEFAQGGNPAKSEYAPAISLTGSKGQARASIEFRRHGTGADLAWERSADLRQWTALDWRAQAQAETRKEGSYEWLSFPRTEEREFHRARWFPSALPSVPERHEGPEFYVRAESSASTGSDKKTFLKEYLLSGLPDGLTDFTYQSPYFSPALEVIDPKTGKSLLRAGQAGLFSLQTSLSTKSQERYLLRLTAVEGTAKGRYLLHFPRIPRPADYLTIGRESSGTLSTRSDFDGSYYSNPWYLVTVQTGDNVELTMRSDPEKGGFRPFLAVLDDQGTSIVETTGEPKTETIVSFRAQPGKRYYAFASSLEPLKLGKYTILLRVR